MYIRNYKGKMVAFNWQQYHSEKELYRALWKIRYNIEYSDDSDNIHDVKYFIKYIK